MLVPIPNWFIPICDNASQSVKKFKEFFVENSETKHLEELRNLFGDIHFQKVQSCLPAKLGDKFKRRLNKRSDRFIIIWNHFLHFLNSDTPLSKPQRELLGRLYKNSAFSGKDPQDLLIQDLLLYLLGRPMPLQESKTLNCYSIMKMKIHMDVHALGLDNLITSLFKLGAQRFSKNNRQFSLEEKCLLFKTAAIISEKKNYSWGELVVDWSRAYENNETASKIHNKFCDELLIPAGESLHLLPRQTGSLSFKQYVIRSTLHLYFHLAGGLFPYDELICQELAKAFSAAESDLDRQNFVYYLDTLAVHQNKGLSFEQAHQILHSLIEKRNGAVYNFLHAALHYFFALRHLDVENDKKMRCKKFLLKAIYAVPLERRIFFDKVIKGEKYKRDLFQLNRDYVEFSETHPIPLKSWGEILLRFSRADPGSQESPYLDSQDHLELIKQVEELLGGTLPQTAIEDLLFFQNAKKDVFGVVDRFIEFRKLIFDKYLDDISIPDAAYNELINLFQSFIEQFISSEVQFPNNVNGYRERSDRFPMLVFGIARMLQMAVYPKAVMSFKELFPQSIEKMTGSFVQKMQYFDPSYIQGPLWKGGLTFAGEEGFLSISIMNSLSIMRTCSFTLKLPRGAFLDLQFFKELLDGLGRETMSDENVKANSMSLSISSSNTPSALQFDWYMKNSPLVQESYLSSRHYKEYQKQENKREMFEFVRSFHSLFKKAFYLTLMDIRSPRAVHESDLHLLYPFEDGFYLQMPHDGIPVEDIHVLRRSHYQHVLEGIYEQWQRSRDEIFVAPSPFLLFIGTEKIKGAHVILKIHTGMLQVLWEMHIGEKAYSRMIEYPSLDTKERFVHAMLWHLALLKQEFLIRACAIPWAS